MHGLGSIWGLHFRNFLRVSGLRGDFCFFNGSLKRVIRRKVGNGKGHGNNSTIPLPTPLLILNIPKMLAYATQ